MKISANEAIENNSLQGPVSNRNDVAYKSTNLPYFGSIKKEGNIYSIDKLRIKFKMHSVEIMQTVMKVLEKGIKDSWDNQVFDACYDMTLKRFVYKYNFQIHTCFGFNFWVGFSFNGTKDQQTEGIIEFNPNKCLGHEVELWQEMVDHVTGEIFPTINRVDLMRYLLINLIVNNSKWVKIQRFDIAIDVAYPKSQVKLIKDNRTKERIEPSDDPNTFTEYLGTRNTSGFCKIYSKKKESNLDYELTRIELTSEHYNDYKKCVAQFPKVYVANAGVGGSLNPYKDLKGTDLAICLAFPRLPDCDELFNMLGRKKKEKLEPYIYNSSANLKITIPEDVYRQLMQYLNNLITGV